MALTPGTRFGSYEVIGALGVGGMGEVYRARDTKLNRDVALKVLPDAFAQDPERLARFEREAQVLASLNHPHIAAIYGMEKTSGVFSGSGSPEKTPDVFSSALVMELVEGDDLSVRIAGGPLPLREAVAIAQQIAEALDAAHEQGIIHRDLKPANVKVRDDGTVKVLDFGLAKALAPAAASGSDAMNSPTLTARATEMGVILGTASYMAPEQAKGKAADRRADIWAFGVVLFEMLTGRQVFTGETASEVMASVMKEEVDWSQLPANLPASIQRLLRRCLEKDPRKRLSSMGDARLELGESDAAPVTPAPASAARGSLGRLAGAIAVGAVVTTAVFLFVVPALRPAADRLPTRVSVLGPPGVTLSFDAAESAISPDGRSIVFTAVDANGTTRLWLRALDALDAHPLAGTESGFLPFWSPDSRQIAFFSNGKLRKMPAGGGTVEALCDAKDGRGGSWGTQNVIVFSPSSAGPLESVSANGGEPKAATSIDAARGETGHRFPSFLPDGRHFLFAALPSKNGKFDLYVGSLDAPERQPMLPAASAAVYAEPGYLLYSRQNVLVAQRFDAGTRQASGDPVAISDAPSSTGSLYYSGRPVSVSTTGTLAYLGDRLPDTRLTWFDRSGRETGTLAVPDGRYQEIAFAPDGRRAAVTRYESQIKSDIWIADVERGGATRFTSAPGLNQEVVWSPDGSRILFAGDRDGPRDFFLKPASGATPEESSYASAAMFKDPRSWSPDGKVLVFEQLDPQTNRDLWLLPMDGDRTPKLYLRTPFIEASGTISPDGQWMAYLSDESGRSEVYVDTFPTPRNKYRVSDQGAFSVFWRKDGRELAILSADLRSLLVAEVSAGADFHASAPRQIVALPQGTVFAQPTPDFQRVLAAVPVSENSASTLTVVLDWIGALRKK
jgi:eukaryotic-like serine/threonine-protein kinase